MNPEIEKIYLELQGQQPKLKSNLVDSCNNLSMYNAGTNIVNHSQSAYTTFFSTFSLEESYTEEQNQLVVVRATAYKSLIEEAYNDNLYKRSKVVPVNIAGPSNYPAQKMNKLIDSHMTSENMWVEKINRFLENTASMIEKLTPVEQVIEDYGSGQRSSAPISSSDPHALEKLTAKLAYHNLQQAEMKKANVHYRKNKTMVGFENMTDTAAMNMDKHIDDDYRFNKQPYPSFRLTNNNATIKSIQKRIDTITSHRADQGIKGYSFEGGEVVANYEIDRLQIFFDEKPEKEMRTTMKSVGFSWSPKNDNAWQRQLTSNALYAANRILPQITQEQATVENEIEESDDQEQQPIGMSFGGMSM